MTTVAGFGRGRVAGRGAQAGVALRGGRADRRVRALAVLAGVAVAVAVGGLPGMAAGVPVAVVLWWAAGRWSGDAAADRRAAGELPVAVDLISAALRAGAPPARAAEVVGEALGGPLGVRLSRVGTALRLGTPASAAWAPIAAVPGGERLRRTAVRSAASGAALTGALDRLAGDLRAVRASDAEAGAARLGVLVVLPLGLCFLPAFLLTGVVPVVVAVLGDVLRSR